MRENIIILEHGKKYVRFNCPFCECSFMAHTDICDWLNEEEPGWVYECPECGASCFTYKTKWN